MDVQPKPLRRDAAAEFVRDTYGIPCSARTLAKFASGGGGPKFRYIGRFPVYSTVDLADWAQRKTSRLVGSVTEHRLIADTDAA